MSAGIPVILLRRIDAEEHLIGNPHTLVPFVIRIFRGRRFWERGDA